MNIQSDINEHCRPCGITLHTYSNHKHSKQKKQFLNNRKKNQNMKYVKSVKKNMKTIFFLKSIRALKKKQQNNQNAM